MRGFLVTALVLVAVGAEAQQPPAAKPAVANPNQALIDNHGRA